MTHGTHQHASVIADEEIGHCQVDGHRSGVCPKRSYPYQMIRSAAETVHPCHVARRSFNMAR